MLLSWTEYFDKCLTILNSEQLVKLNQDPTATTQRKVQRILRKIKQILPKEKYQKSNCLESFMEPQKFINCHQAKVLSPLSRSDYTFSSSKEFTEIIKFKYIPDNFKLASFDVKSLFRNVLSDSTTDFILNRISDNKS